MLAVSAVMGACARGTYVYLDAWLGHAAVATRLLQVGGAIIVAFFVFYGGCKLLRVTELDMALMALRQKRKGSTKE